MNLPWTQAGLPAVGLPAGTIKGLPMGLQVVGRWNGDEALLAHARALEAVAVHC
jgi:Asp-tRNA(Asn)/Glu-tRNA(Gln) amidotransferase A subunit family amidase